MSAEPMFKRRKLNENAHVLTKPFVSPLKTTRAGRQPLQPNENALNLPYQPSVLAHTIKATAAHVRGPDAVKSVNQTPSKSTPIRKSHYSRPTANRPNPDELAAQRALTALELQIRTIRNEIDTLTQAAQLLSSSTDAKLKDLAQKWKCASQAAAEEVFATVKERVDHLGGVAAWRRSQRQEYERNNRWDDENGVGKEDDRDCEFDSEGEELDEEEKERRKETKRRMMEEMQRAVETNADRERVAGRADESGDQHGDKDEAFTMEMMLRSLNIELDVIGYDKAGQTWTA